MLIVENIVEITDWYFLLKKSTFIFISSNSSVELAVSLWLIFFKFCSILGNTVAGFKCYHFGSFLLLVNKHVEMCSFNQLNTYIIYSMNVISLISLSWSINCFVLIVWLMTILLKSSYVIYHIILSKKFSYVLSYQK